MTLPAGLESIDGARELFGWFGYWPSFHDAEVLSFRLELGNPAALLIHTWEMTDKVTESGFYELIKHVTVELVIKDVTSLNLEYPWKNSILFDLGINRTDIGFRIDLSSSYGLSGTIEAKEVSIRITPGKQEKGSSIQT